MKVAAKVKVAIDEQRRVRIPASLRRLANIQCSTEYGVCIADSGEYNFLTPLEDVKNCRIIHTGKVDSKGRFIIKKDWDISNEFTKLEMFVLNDKLSFFFVN